MRPFFMRLLLYPLVAIIVSFKKHRRLFFSVLLIGLGVYGVHIVKNTIQTGWPIYPVTQVNFGAFDWQYPKEKGR